MTLTDKVKRILYQQIGDKACLSIAVNQSILGLGIDSLDVLEVIMALEEEFDMKIPDKEIEDLLTVERISTYVIANGYISPEVFVDEIIPIDDDSGINKFLDEFFDVRPHLTRPPKVNGQYLIPSEWQSVITAMFSLYDSNADVVIIESGEECAHRGCSSHHTTPCEGCGRIGAVGPVRMSRSLLEQWVPNYRR